MLEIGSARYLIDCISRNLTRVHAKVAAADDDDDDPPPRLRNASHTHRFESWMGKFNDRSGFEAKGGLNFPLISWNDASPPLKLFWI